MFFNSMHYYLPHGKLQQLIAALNKYYICFGPTVRDDAIVYDPLTHVDQLPWGIQETQSPGRYQLKKILAQKAFAWANGPSAIKPLLFKPYETLWYVKKSDGKLYFEPANPNELPIAIFGARPCDLAAMAIQDKIFMQGDYVDIRYKKRRENLFVVAVNCTYSAGNCFCVSAGGSTKATEHFDIVMTELDDGFVVAPGTKRGQKILKTLALKEATDEQQDIASKLVDHAAHMQTKKLPEINFRQVLFDHLEHPRWEEVAKRCLACGNCTQVCPTCFCHNAVDRPQIDGQSSEHIRMWDSCFTKLHSHLSGGSVRKNTKEDYRQWLTHKLAGWFDQFGMSGCVGCGRCITWCPVGIDIAEEVNALVDGENNERE
jgi:sulfhydrogenase subunit beta (sulfur reductase)